MQLKLTLRDLFWLTLVVAMALGWWGQYSSSNQRLSVLQTELKLARSNIADVRQFFEHHGYEFSYTTDGAIIVFHTPDAERNP
jgi:hypothetical protein